jgi:Subtilase family
MPIGATGAHGRYRSVTVTTCVVILAVTAGLSIAGESFEADGREDLRVVQTSEDGPIFETWQETGRRWVSISSDSGGTWSEPRAMIDEIPLQAGLIAPGRSLPALPKNLVAGDDSRVFLVQFQTQSLAAWRARLRELGAEVLSYVPHNSHIVRMDPKLVSSVEAQSFVRWVGSYEPSYRTFPDLLAEIEDRSPLTRRFNIMTYTPGAEEKGLLASEIESMGGQVLVAESEGYILEAMLSDAQAYSLLASDFVQWIDEWSAPEVDMDIGRVVAGADYVLGVDGYDGTGVRGEVVDMAVDMDHPDLPNFSVAPGSNLIHGSIVPSGVPSYDRHGTPTYGINFGTGSGNAAATGMVPGATGYFAYTNYVFPNRYAHTAELVNPSLEYQVVYQSNSTGDPTTTSYTSISAAMDDMIWQYDIAIFQSQSNTATQESRPQAWAKNIISVGAFDHHNNTDPLDDDVSNASVGPAADGRIKPDLSFFYDATLTTDEEPGGYVNGSLYYTNFGGTSGATPMTAGTSGLFFQMWQDNVWGTAPGSGTVFEERPHFTTMKAMMINSASQYDWNSTNPTLTRFRQGWGRPSAQSAYDRAAKTVVLDETSVLEVMQKDSYTATVPAAHDALKVTMVYSDRAGSPASTPHRINDVTLKVVAPDGTVYWGNNGLESGIWSTPDGAPDTINKVENVFIQNPAAGDWRIEVEAVEVNMDVHIETPEDDQDYALVIYGVTDLSDYGPIIFSDGFETGNIDQWSRVNP